MQGRDEYEFDYYGGAPFRADDYPGGIRQNMQRDQFDGYWQEPGSMSRRSMRSEPMMLGQMPSRQSCCQGRMNEILEEMERFEALQHQEIRRINAEIRKVCGAVDGRGSIAIEGEPSREMMEMLMEQVMDRLEQMPNDSMESDSEGMELSGVQINESQRWQRHLVEALIWQELFRRRMRRRMHGRRGRY